MYRLCLWLSGLIHIPPYCAGTRTDAMKPTDPTNAQRQAAARKRLIEEGGRQMSLMIPPDINARLNAEMERTGESARAVILRLLDQGLS